MIQIDRRKRIDLEMSQKEVWPRCNSWKSNEPLSESRWRVSSGPQGLAQERISRSNHLPQVGLGRLQRAERVGHRVEES